MNDKEYRRNEDERELNRLGNSGHEGGQCRREQDTGCNFREARLADHGQACRRQAKHHDGEEAGHEVSSIGITREVSRQVAMHHPLRASIVAKLKPDIGIEHVVQAKRDK